MMTRIAILLTVVFAGGVGAWTDVSPVNTFVDSGIIYASDHNENDSALASSINELEDTVDQYYMRWTDVEDGDSTLSRINADTIGSNPYMDSAVIDEIDINGGAIDGTVIGANSAAAGTFSTVNTGQGDYELYSMNQDVETTDGVTFSTVNTGQGANELYDMNQNVQTTDAVDFATVNTGQGDNELYAMNQDVQTSDNVYFTTVNTGQGDYELYAMNQNVQTTNAVSFASVNTGHGINELYAMDQDVQTGDAVTFATVNTGQGDYELYSMNQDVETTDGVTFSTVNTGQGDNELYAMDQDVQTTDDVVFDTVECTMTSAQFLELSVIPNDGDTLSGDTLQVTRSHMTIFPETGNRDTIETMRVPGTTDTGPAILIVLSPETGDTIDVVETGNILLSSASFSMDSQYDRIVLMRHITAGGYTGNRYVELSRSDND